LSFKATTSSPGPDDLHPEEAMDILRQLGAMYPITGADMMEIAPFTDSSGRGASSVEQTLKVAAEISAFLLSEMDKR